MNVTGMSKQQDWMGTRLAVTLEQRHAENQNASKPIAQQSDRGCLGENKVMSRKIPLRIRKLMKELEAGLVRIYGNNRISGSSFLSEAVMSWARQLI